ncbi:MAG: glutamate--tRNA ligase family protein, partial [Chitinophagaceae bacterium]
EKDMPQWAHLPLILKPDGHGKLSKRDGDILGFPVFAMNWKDPKSGEETFGFREIGFLPEAFLNMLAALGWNAGSEQEIYSLDELIQAFSIERVHKGGAKFDFEKAKWYNHEWIKRSHDERLLPDVRKTLSENGITADDTLLIKVIPLVKERCTLMTDFIQQCGFFFKRPNTFDTSSFTAKWSNEKKHFFEELCRNFAEMKDWNASLIEETFKNLSVTLNMKPGELQLPLRVMLVGGKFGPPVFEIASLLAKEESISRIQLVIHEL